MESVAAVWQVNPAPMIPTAQRQPLSADRSHGLVTGVKKVMIAIQTTTVEPRRYSAEVILTVMTAASETHAKTLMTIALLARHCVAQMGAKLGCMATPV